MPDGLEVEEHEVGLGADLDPRRLQAVDARRPRAHALEQRGQGDDPRLDQLRVERGERCLEAGDAEGRLLERHLLLLAGVRSVVGGDRLDRAVEECLDESRPVLVSA